MNKRMIQGWAMIVLSILLFLFYTYVLFFAPRDILAKVFYFTVYVIITLILASIAYIGYLFAKTPTLRPEEVYKLLNKDKEHE
ncbi:hypothetical protein ACSU1N_05290 [Thermogladius sp. 4427co]|uniref:hypothetical protein n=1 Tax=Thermogladius sp. 4427co TaxID=3450718 RepID=UPI003F7940BA